VEEKGEPEAEVIEEVPEPEILEEPVPVMVGEWQPRTRLGRMVQRGEITSMAQALRTGLPLREPEIVDILLPELDDEVLSVKMVQRMTDSGRRVKFAITTVVGNKDGYVGLGYAKGKEVGPAIRKSIDNAKINIIEIRRGCGSWECGCGKPHSLPFAVRGKCGSVEVTFKPAPRGISLAAGNIAKHILRLAGIKDAWAYTSGETRTQVNYAKAAFYALAKTAQMKVTRTQEEELHIVSGPVEVSALTELPAGTPPEGGEQEVEGEGEGEGEGELGSDSSGGGQ
jgi:small subunit ribosomal protein S5